MSFDPISSGIDLVTSIISRVWPDKTAQEKAQLEAAMRSDDNFTKLLNSQLQVNQEEAKSSSLFTSGWRPSVGWTCSAIFAYNYLVQPILLFVCTSLHHPLPPLPSLNDGAVMGVLMGMLGIGSMRTYERVKGVSPKGK